MGKFKQCRQKVCERMGLTPRPGSKPLLPSLVNLAVHWKCVFLETKVRLKFGERSCFGQEFRNYFKDLASGHLEQQGLELSK